MITACSRTKGSGEQSSNSTQRLSAMAQPMCTHTGSGDIQISTWVAQTVARGSE